jgi:hypothetical protein
VRHTLTGGRGLTGTRRRIQHMLQVDQPLALAPELRYLVGIDEAMIGDLDQVP